jgi:hypothetical protein
MQKIQQSSEDGSVESVSARSNSSAFDNRNACLLPLPRRDIRWNPQRKAEVVAAVRGGIISLDKACEIYELSLEEFSGWQREGALHGLAGPRATALRSRDAAPINARAKEIPPNVPTSVPAENS